MRQSVQSLSTKFKTAVLTLVLLTAQAAGAALPFMPNSIVHADSNNGTLQVHEQGDPSFKRDTSPHVCIFDFEAFDLDANQTGNVTITPQAPTSSNGTPDGNPLVLPLTTDSHGNGATDYVNDGTPAYALKDGHYKATLDDKFGTDPYSKAKSKVFWVDCPRVQPTLTTQVSSSAVSVGTPVHDTATLTGDFNHGDVTGTVQFYRCGPGSSTPPCYPRTVGSAVTVTNGQAVSPDFTPGYPGEYCFWAAYTPDHSADYDGVIATSRTNECFTVTVPGSITVTKVVQNTHGGTAKPGDFPLYVGNTQVTSGTKTSFASGQQYTVSENGGPSGYHQTSASCVDAYSHYSLGTTFTLWPGQNVTCTITNQDIAPVLNVTKHVTNTHGGTMWASDFKLSVNGSQLLPADAKKGGGTLADNSVTYEFPNAAANTPYTVSEASANGYTQQSLICMDEVTHTTVAQPVTLQPGQQVECTVTNHDVAPQLTVIKHVVNGYGGTAKASDFTMNVTGTNVSAPTFPGAESGTAVTLDAGSFDVSELGGPSGYTGSMSGDCSGTIAVGDSKTCTLTNTQQPASISGHKYDVSSTAKAGDGSGNPLQNWTVYLLVNGQAIAHTTTDAGGNYAFNGLNWGNYTLAECQNAGDGCTGWSPVYTPAGVTLNGSSLNSANNDFGNHAHGTIKVMKNVDTDGDGTVDRYGATDWQWDVDGSGSYATGTTQTVDSSAAGVGYTVSEEGQSGYHFSSVTCTDNGYPMSVRQSASVNVTVNPGNDIVCTFTNTRDTGYITVTKYIDPWNDSGLFDLQVDGNTDATDVTSGGTTGAVRVVTGMHTIGELAGTGTSLSDYDTYYECFSGYNLIADGSTTTSDPFSVSTNQQVDCYIFNTRHATITVIKNVDDGLGNVTQDVTDWQWDIDGSGSYATGSNNSQAVSAYNTYTVSEEQKTGYHVMASSCTGDSQEEEEFSVRALAATTPGTPSTSLTVYAGAGNNIICTFTNTRDTGTLTITKKAYPYGSSQAFTFDVKSVVSASSLTNLPAATNASFQLDDNADPALPNTRTLTLPTGVYTVEEAATQDWNLVGLDCGNAKVTVNGAVVTFTVTAGGSISCTYTNQKPVVPQVLGASTSKMLTNTGLPVLAYTLAALTFLTSALWVVRRREV